MTNQHKVTMNPPSPVVLQGQRFQTLRFLGKGGQGFVQLAFDEAHRQHVAIK